MLRKLSKENRKKNSFFKKNYYYYYWDNRSSSYLLGFFVFPGGSVWLGCTGNPADFSGKGMEGRERDDYIRIWF